MFLAAALVCLADLSQMWPEPLARQCVAVPALSSPARGFVSCDADPSRADVLASTLRRNLIEMRDREGHRPLCECARCTLIAETRCTLDELLRAGGIS